MSALAVTHVAAFAVRFSDHFTGRAIGLELPVRLAGTWERPVMRPDGGGTRQADGSYRFIDLPPGAHDVLWRPPFTRDHAGWTDWGRTLTVNLPQPSPLSVLERDLWPTAGAPAPAGALAVRGRIDGAGAGYSVRISVPSTTPVHETWTDDLGDFLFLPQGRIPAEASGRLPLQIAVADPGGIARGVSGGTVEPLTAPRPFVSDRFSLRPGSAARVLFQLA